MKVKLQNPVFFYYIKKYLHKPCGRLHFILQKLLFKTLKTFIFSNLHNYWQLNSRINIIFYLNHIFILQITSVGCPTVRCQKRTDRAARVSTDRASWS